MWQLFGTLRNGKPLKYDFHPDRLTIGRAPSNSIQLEDETVSCLHAEIELVSPDKYVLRDLGSKNGTFVNGAAVTEIEISNPCKIAFGALMFEVRIGGEADTAGPSAEVASAWAQWEKLRCEFESERKSCSEQIAHIARENEERLLEKGKECEALTRTVEEARNTHGAELKNDRREHSGKMAKIEKQNEARLLEKQKECEALNRMIEELKRAHRAELKNEKRGHSVKMESIEKQSEARVQEKQKECEALNRTIEQLKGTHRAELENEKREHSVKIESIEKQSDARVQEKQKEYEALNRTIEVLKGAHQTEIENEKREHSVKVESIEKQNNARVLEKQKECEALNRTIEELKGTHAVQSESECQANRERVANLERESEANLRKKQEECDALNRTIDGLKKTPGSQAEATASLPSDDSSEVDRKPKTAAAKSRFAWATLAYRRGMDHWRRTILCLGLLCFGVCLLAQSLPSSVLPIIISQRIAHPGARMAVPSVAQDAAQETPTACAARVPGIVPQICAPDSGSLLKVANEALEDPSSGENPGDPVDIKPRGERVAAAGVDENPVTPNPDDQVKNAPSDEPSTRVTKANPAENAAAAVDPAVQAPTAICPCATPWQDDGLPEIAERPASDAEVASAPHTNSADPIALDEVATDQNAPAPREMKGVRVVPVGFRLQEVAPEAVEPGSDRGSSDAKAPATKRENPAATPAPANGGAAKGSRGSLDQAKADSPSSITKALTHKDSPDGKAIKGAPPLRILILGDSLSLCGFGKRLDQKFRNDPQVQSVFTYMACGTHPLSWIKEKPYATVKTYCGFWSIESSTGQPKEMEDTYGMKPGYVPKPHPVPKVEDLLEALHPDILVMQCGTNLFSLFESRTTVQPVKDGPMVRHYITPFLNAARKCMSLRKIYWVAPPTSGRSPVAIQDFVFGETRSCADWLATVIDSRPLVSYPYHQMEPDHEHFMGTDMTQWADRIYEFVKQDLSSQPFSSLPVLAQLQPPAKIQPPVKKEAEQTETQLYVRARLSFKSQPIPLKELMPYQESLVGFVYDVSQVVNGKYEDKQILVLHPSCIGLKPQPLDKYKMGKVYNLRLREVEATPWHTVKCQDESGRIDLIPYIQVEDEKKFPGNSH
jgi:pSer/pThr/pTyr-binding forkhead associated (FHA) protein